MERTKNTVVAPAFRRITASAAAFTLTVGGSVAALTVVPTIAAHAQSGNIADSTRPVMNRAAMMLQAAQARQNRAPEAAQASYRNAADSLRQALTAGRFSAGNAPAAFSDPKSAAGLPVSSAQVADDIRVLRNAAKNAKGAQAADLQKVASLYANGAKEFFTGQLREALLGDIAPSRVITIRKTGSASSSALPRVSQGGVLLPDGTITQDNPQVGAPALPITNTNPVTSGAISAPIGGPGVIVTPPVVDTPGVVTAPVVVPTAPVVSPTNTPPTTNPTTTP